MVDQPPDHGVVEPICRLGDSAAEIAVREFGDGAVGDEKPTAEHVGEVGGVQEVGVVGVDEPLLAGVDVGAHRFVSVCVPDKLDLDGAGGATGSCGVDGSIEDGVDTEEG